MLQAKHTLSQILSPDAVAQKTVGTVHKQMGVTVFQRNFIYKNRQWAKFSLQALVCQPQLKSSSDKI